jgi:hypothetical protein
MLLEVISKISDIADGTSMMWSVQDFPNIFNTIDFSRILHTMYGFYWKTKT